MSEKSSSTNQILSLFCISILLLSITSYFPNSIPDAEGLIADKKEIRIASWNLWDFSGPTSGSWKWSTTNNQCLDFVCAGYRDVITNGNYDLIFIQEIKGKQNDVFPSAFNDLCKRYLNPAGYTCKNTQNMGPSAGNNEAYGIIYKNSLGLAKIQIEYTGNPGVIPTLTQGSTGLAMVRPPMKATITFDDSGHEIIFFNNHLKAGSPRVQAEMTSLDNAIRNNGLLANSNIVVLGDLNADGGTYAINGSGNCNNYYAPGNPVNATGTQNFLAPDWTWVIPNGETTNMPNAANSITGKRGCAYDRIIISQSMTNHHDGNYGIVSTIPNQLAKPDGTNIPADTKFKNNTWNGPKGTDVYGLSDHALIWANFNYGGIESDRTRYMDKTQGSDCETPDKVFASGEGFISNDTVDIYITRHPDNQNFIPQPQPLDPINIGNFKQNDQSYNLVDARVTGPTTVMTDIHGNITKTMLWIQPDYNPRNPEFYNVIVDVNRDGMFTNNVDVVDVFNKAGFTVRECQIQEKATVTVKESVGGAIQRSYSEAFGPSFDGSNWPPGKVMKVCANQIPNSNAPSAMNIAQCIFSQTVTANSQGKFSVTWNNPTSGLYNVILDVNNNNTYESDVDLVAYPDEADFIVYPNSNSHNDIIHLGDNGLEREVYDTEVAQNIYTLANNLSANETVDVYVISEKILKQNISNWSTWESVDDIELIDNATPVYEFGQKKITLRTSSDGTLFFSQWHNPSQIFDQEFINYYGKKFNTVIDVNNDGLFNPSHDKVDTHDIGHMNIWFLRHDILDSSANGLDPVSEYKEYLNDKLDLEEQLDTNSNNYDSATEQASMQYLCSKYPTYDLFSVIEAGSQVGFRVLDTHEYYSERNVSTGRHVYDTVEFEDVNIKDDTTSVMVSPNGTITASELNVGHNSNLFICDEDVVKIQDFTASSASTTTINANTVELNGDVHLEQNSKTCITATGSGAVVVLGAGLAILATGVSAGTALPFIAIAGATGLGVQASCIP